jgi:hypothetical protein
VVASFNEGFVRLAWLKGLVHRAGNWIIIVTQVILLCAAAFVINRRKEQMLTRYGKTKVVG